MNVDQIRELISLMKENRIRELDWDSGEGKLRLVAQDMVTVAPASAAGQAQFVHAAPSAAESPAEAAPEHREVIASPIVGTFYSSPAPDKPEFVRVGDVVNPETVVCIIEAMKVMNEIKAEKSGRVIRVLASNGQAVEYGQPMFVLE